MKPIVAFAALLWNLAFAAAPSTDKPDQAAVDQVQTAFDKLVRATTAKDWQSELAAREKPGQHLGGPAP